MIFNEKQLKFCSVLHTKLLYEFTTLEISLAKNKYYKRTKVLNVH